VLFVLLGAAGYGIWHGTRLPAVTITTVTVVGGETIPVTRISERAEAELAGSYFHLIPYRFSYFYPRNAITAAVAELPRVKDVHVERVSRHELVIAFSEYRPVALWCVERNARECLFLDDTGYAFAAAPPLEGAAYVRYVEQGTTPAVGPSPFAGERIVATNAFITQVYDDLNFNIIAAEQSGRDTLTYHVAGGGEIKVARSLSAADTLVNLATILQSPEFAHLAPGSFRYIDLRFGDKIFINEELEPVATSTPTSTDAVIPEDEETETATSTGDGAD
jgi:cell division septal protein FtsQ